jgi:hypothetical protein
METLTLGVSPPSRLVTPETDVSAGHVSVPTAVILDVADNVTFEDVRLLDVCDNMAPMNKKRVFRIAIELLTAAFLMIVGVRKFFLPQFGWPNWIFFGPAIAGILIALLLIADAARIVQRKVG